MAHHSGFPESDEVIRQLRRELQSSGHKLGATGSFPQGRLTPGDEGEIKLAVASTNGKVVIDFGKPVVWIGFDPEQARGLAAMLLKHADAASSGGQQ